MTKNEGTIWVAQINDTMERAPKGSEWLHKKSGGLYTVVGYTIIESTWELGIVYEAPLRFPLPITRAAGEFFDGRFERQGDN